MLRVNDKYIIVRKMKFSIYICIKVVIEFVDELILWIRNRLLV